MGDKLRVSVVIAVDETGTQLEAAVRSALAVDVRELEVLVVDNSPDDRSTAALRDVVDERVVRVRLRPGRGPLRPRNVGIARARAPYVALLDPDNLLKPDRLSDALRALDNHTEAGFAFSDFAVVEERGNTVRPSGIGTSVDFGTVASEPLGDGWRLIRQPDLARGLLHGNPVGMSGVVLRRRLFTEIGPFDESAACWADLDLWFRLGHYCAALYSSEVSHTRRDKPQSDAVRPRAATEECIAVLRREKSRWSERAARRQLDRLIAEHLASVANEEGRHRRRLRSTAMYAYAFATCPDRRWLSGMVHSLLS